MSSRVTPSLGIFPLVPSFSHARYHSIQTANKKELVDDLMLKAKQIEHLIQSLPTPEPEEVQVRVSLGPTDGPGRHIRSSVVVEFEIDD
jgi:hypothetical protein